jgi:hypothetical protein
MKLRMSPYRVASGLRTANSLGPLCFYEIGTDSSDVKIYAKKEKRPQDDSQSG